MIRRLWKKWARKFFVELVFARIITGVIHDWHAVAFGVVCY